MLACPRAHLFGHLHEQRGLWHKTADGFKGGIEYRATPESVPYPTTGPPPADYPCELVSCNAMSNHGGIDGLEPHIAGGGRLICMEPRGQPGVSAPPEGGTFGPTLISKYGRDTILACDGTDVVATQLNGNLPPRSRWLVVPCPYEERRVYLVDEQSGMFLDTHGAEVSVWNVKDRPIKQVIAENVTRYAGNLRWILSDSPSLPGAFYIVSSAHSKLLSLSERGRAVLRNADQPLGFVLENGAGAEDGDFLWTFLQRAQ